LRPEFVKPWTVKAVFAVIGAPDHTLVNGGASSWRQLRSFAIDLNTKEALIGRSDSYDLAPDIIYMYTDIRDD
jgi:hypothetical protein